MMALHYHCPFMIPASSTLDIGIMVVHSVNILFLHAASAIALSSEMQLRWRVHHFRWFFTNLFLLTYEVEKYRIYCTSSLPPK